MATGEKICQPGATTTCRDRYRVVGDAGRCSNAASRAHLREIDSNMGNETGALIMVDSFITDSPWRLDIIITRTSYMPSRF